MTENAPRRDDLLISLALGLLALAVYLASATLTFHSIDEVAVFSVTRSLIARGSFDGDVLFWTRSALGRGSIVAEGMDGHTYVVKDVAPVLLSVPLVALAPAAEFSPVRSALLLSPLISALTTSLIYIILRKWGYRQSVGVLGALTFAFASLAWPYAETLFTQPLAALGLLIALHSTIRAREGHGWRAGGLGGLGLGIAGLSAVPTWVSLPIYPLYIMPWELIRKGEWRQALAEGVPPIVGFGAGAGAFVLIQALYNLIRFGSPLQTGYQQVGASSIQPMYLGIGLFGQLLSTPRGVIWYAPFVLLILFGLWVGWRRSQRSRLGLALAQAAIIFLLYSSYLTWWAGVCWGPRFLVAIMPTLAVMTAPLWEHLISPAAALWERLLAGVVWALSAITQLLATLFDPLYTEPDISAQLQAITPPPPGAIRAPVLTNFHHLPFPRQIAAARAGQWDVLWVSEAGIDALLLGCCVALIVLAGIGLILSLWRAASRLALAGVSLQAALSLGLIALMLARYPQGPNHAAGLDAMINTLSERAQPGDGIIAMMPNFLDWMDSYDSALQDTGMVFENPLTERTEQRLSDMQDWYGRVWLVSEGTVGGNPDNGVERWLADHAYIGTETWVEGYRLVPYTSGIAGSQNHASDAVFGADLIELTSYEIACAAGWINVTLVWSARQPIPADYVIFVHLLDGSGALVAQHDGPPRAGYAPTHTWEPGTPITDRRSIILPDSLPPGEYQLIVGLYVPTTGQRLPLADSSGDALPLGPVRIP